MIISYTNGIAKEVGVLGAILIEGISFWVFKNEANEKHFYNGQYWTYNTLNAYSKIYIGWSERKIQLALKKLEDDGYLVTGSYNKIKYDRTKWYSLTAKGLGLIEKTEKSQISCA